jgi:glycerol-3-phosphate acyltransferase PlsY
MTPYLYLLLAYVLGSTPTSFWVGRYLFGVDLRRVGSGNLGATNTYRALGWKAAIPVGLVDVEPSSPVCHSGLTRANQA